MFRKTLHLIKKDFLIETSYTLAFTLNIFTALITIAIYFFIDKLFGVRFNPHLEEFGTTYFPYVLLSLAFFNYIGTGIGSFSSRLRLEQMQGTLEALFLCPIKIRELLLSLCIWNVVCATLTMAFYLGLGAWLFNIGFSNINLLSCALILFLTIISFSSLGILSSCFILIFKRGNPLSWFINTLEGLLGGVYFPVTVLPGFLQVIAHLLPITYAIRALELAVYRGYTITQLKTEIIILFGFSLILLPVSINVFGKAFNEARKRGSLSLY